MLKFISGLTVLGVLSIVLLLVLLLSHQPTVKSTETLSHQHIAHVRQVVRAHLAENLRNQTHARIQFGEQDLNVIANYLLQRSTLGSANIALSQQMLAADVSLPLAFFELYLNIHLQLVTPSGKPEVEQFTLGQLTLPQSLGHWLVFRGIQQWLDFNFSQQIQTIQIHDNLLDLVYRPEQRLVQRVKQKLFNLGEPEALHAYADKLHQLQQQPVGQQRQLNLLLRAVFTFAQERSQAHDPVQENVALLTVLGLWAAKQRLSSHIPDLAHEPKKFNLKLHRRIDAARHFLISAALAVRGDHRIAEVIGVSKELVDAENRSGFSFADLAANEAGIAFGLLAKRSVKDAHDLQHFMAQKFADTDVIPMLKNLPENMSLAEFRRRFGGIDQPAYAQVIDEIKQQVTACRLHQRR